jgi:hypothetical protein
MSEALRISLTLEALRARRDEILASAARYGVTNVRVFGSVARGEAGPASDVDFLVRYGPKTTLVHVVGLEHALEELLLRPVDVIDDMAIRSALRTSILDEAVPL